MKKIELGFEFRASPRVLSGSFAGLMLCAMSGELAPESVSLSTYFPAPSGVYSQMITTGSTYLARDGANAVGIGTTNLVSGAKLRVAGQSVMEGGTLLEARDGTASPGGTARLRIKTESNDLNFYGYDTSEFKFMGVSNSGAKSVSFQVDVGFTNTTPEAPIDVGGVIVLRQPRSDCSETPFTGGANTQCSPAGSTYATMIAGVVSKVGVPWGTNFGAGTAGAGGGETPGSGYMLCCKCPTSGCPSGSGWDF